MNYKACPAFLFHSCCPFGDSCPFLHIPSQKTCLKFSQTGFCKYFPHCKFLHLDYSLALVLQPKDTYLCSDEFFKKNLEQKIYLETSNYNEITYNITLNQEMASSFYFKEGLRKFLLELFAENKGNTRFNKTLTINLNANFIENFSIALSLLHSLVQKTEILILSLTNVCINDGFLMEFNALFNNFKALNVFHLSFQNCVFFPSEKTKENESFCEKMQFLKEFRFVINYDYDKENNRNYEKFLRKMLEKTKKLKKLELILGFSNFELSGLFPQEFQESLCFESLECFYISLANLSDLQQSEAFGYSLGIMPKLKLLSVNFLNHDKRKLENPMIKDQKNLIFTEKMARNMSNLQYLHSLEMVSFIFEDKIHKETSAFELILEFLSQLKSLNCLEMDGSLMLENPNKYHQKKTQNLLNFFTNTQENLQKLSLKLSYSDFSHQNFLTKLFKKLQTMKKLTHLALDLEFTKFNDNLLKKLAFSLKDLIYLKNLNINLSKNRINEQGCQFLSQSLNKMTNLESLFLDLSFNTILDHGFKELLELLPRNLKDLILLAERNAISLTGIQMIRGFLPLKFQGLRKIYIDFLNNGSIGKKGNFLLMEIYEEICRRNIGILEAHWDSDYLENYDNCDELLIRRRDILKNFMIRKKILAYQLKKAEVLKKKWRKSVGVGIILEKFVMGKPFGGEKL